MVNIRDARNTKKRINTWSQEEGFFWFCRSIFWCDSFKQCRHAESLFDMFYIEFMFMLSQLNLYSIHYMFILFNQFYRVYNQSV